MAGVDAEPRLDRAIARNVARTSSDVDARRDLGRARRSPVGAGVRERRERGSMDGAVLADLERREVEPERRQLPAEFGHLAPGDSGQPVVDERRLELGELGVELRSVGVVARTRSRLAGHRRARPPQSLGDEPEALAIRLVGESPPQLPVGLRQVLGIAREPHPERTRDPGMRRRRRDGLHEAQGHGFVARGARDRHGCGASAR